MKIRLEIIEDSDYEGTVIVAKLHSVVDDTGAERSKWGLTDDDYELVDIDEDDGLLLHTSNPHIHGVASDEHIVCGLIIPGDDLLNAKDGLFELDLNHNNYPREDDEVTLVLEEDLVLVLKYESTSEGSGCDASIVSEQEAKEIYEGWCTLYNMDIREWTNTMDVSVARDGERYAFICSPAKRGVALYAMSDDDGESDDNGPA